MRAIVGSMLALAAAAASGSAAVAAAFSPSPELLAAITHSLKLEDRKEAQAMTCGQFPGGGRVQQYCSWRVHGRASFAEIYGAVATQMAPGRWLVTGTARPARTEDVVIRSADADNGKTTTLEACVRKGGAVEPLGGQTVCKRR